VRDLGSPWNSFVDCPSSRFLAHGGAAKGRRPRPCEHGDEETEGRNTGPRKHAQGRAPRPNRVVRRCGTSFVLAFLWFSTHASDHGKTAVQARDLIGFLRKRLHLLLGQRGGGIIGVRADWRQCPP